MHHAVRDPVSSRRHRVGPGVRERSVGTTSGSSAATSSRVTAATRQVPTRDATTAVPGPTGRGAHAVWTASSTSRRPSTSAVRDPSVRGFGSSPQPRRDTSGSTSTTRTSLRSSSSSWKGAACPSRHVPTPVARHPHTSERNDSHAGRERSYLERLRDPDSVNVHFCTMVLASYFTFFYHSHGPPKGGESKDPVRGHVRLDERRKRGDSETGWGAKGATDHAWP